MATATRHYQYATPTPGLDGLLKEFSLLEYFRTFNQKESPARAIGQRITTQYERSRGLFVKSGQSIVLPFEMFRASQQIGVPEYGGHLKGESQTAVEQFLRASTIVRELGATIIDPTGHRNGPGSDVVLPTASAGTQGFWLTEDQEGTQTDVEIGQTLKLQPKTVVTLASMTRNLMQLGPYGETAVLADIQAAVNESLDQAFFTGSGSNGEPLGLLNYPGLNIQSLGADGAAIARLDLIKLEKSVTRTNATANLGFAFHPDLRAKLRATEKTSTSGQFLLEDDNRLLGYPIGVSASVPNNLTKGSGSDLAALVFGSWRDLVICPWGLEILPNPFGPAYSSGGLQVRCMLHVDFAYRRSDKSFAVIKDAVVTL